jgi:hypothetical protein
MKIPGLGSLSAARHGILGGAGIVLAVVLVVFTYTKIDDWRTARRNAQLASAGKQVVVATTLAGQADSVQTEIRPTKQGFNALLNSPQVKNNPTAKIVGDTAKKIIKADSVTIDKQKKAIAHLDTAVTNLQDAGPPLGSRAVPYGIVGYVASSRQRAVPVGVLGLDYRLLPHVMAHIEGSYSPPTPKDLKQTPDWRILVGGKITFR